jgi:hypothetical protein
MPIEDPLIYLKQIHIMHVAICYMMFGAHGKSLFIIKVKILVLIKWSYRPLQLRSLLSLDYLAHFEHVFQSPLNKCLLGVHS